MSRRTPWTFVFYHSPHPRAMFGATNPAAQGAMMLELTKPPAAADRPVTALDCGKPVSLVHCCPFELTTNGQQATVAQL